MKFTTNTWGITINRFMSAAQSRIGKNIERLSSGKRINSAADDASGLGISVSLQNQINAVSTSQDNINSGISLLETGEGALFEMNSILSRIRSLALEASNGTLTSTDRVIIQAEVDSLIEEIDSISTSASFNGIQLFSGDYASGTGSVAIQSGSSSNSTISLHFNEITSTTLGVNGLKVTNSTLASNAVSTLDTALSSVMSETSTVGAYENRLNYSLDFSGWQEISYTDALSNIIDVDFATELTDYTKNQLILQSATYMFSQSNSILKDMVDWLGLSN